MDFEKKIDLVSKVLEQIFEQDKLKNIIHLHSISPKKKSKESIPYCIKEPLKYINQSNLYSTKDLLKHTNKAQIVFCKSIEVFAHGLKTLLYIEVSLFTSQIINIFIAVLSSLKWNLLR